MDAVSPGREIDVLGFRVRSSADDSFQVGDYALVIDWSRRGAKERILEVRPLNIRYVPGVSEVFLRGKLSANDSLRGQATLEKVRIDYSTISGTSIGRAATSGAQLEVRGTQPHPLGLVLGTSATLHNAGSLGTGKLSSSLGTGRIDGSLGTGKQDGSLGTGKLSGSLGTGRNEGSLGTGRTDGSLGTGKLDGSLGTGKLSGSLGTGRIDGSLGTGKLDGSLGTGKLSGSLGTGRTDGSLGTGKLDGSLGTGKLSGSLGTGKID
ncbi:MAG TPA: hypothetical protein VFM30_10025 [Steroidobacteraceae bacterium]|nr:hypothetical protein [Steroidobacteraceae bacterium]